MFEGMILLGENLNATRKLSVTNPKIVTLDGGRKGLPYKGLDGKEKYLDLTEALQSEASQKSGKVGHIAAGIVNRDEEYIASVARTQIGAGADVLDLCVDEISPWAEERHTHMRWLVQTVQKHAKVVVAVDSSDPATIRAGLEVCNWDLGRPMINSVNLEEQRLPMLPIAGETGAILLGNGSGAEGLPSDTAGRVENLTKLMALMDKANIPLERRTLDPLVLPIGTNPEHGLHFLDACAQLRATFGPEFHLTGGFSNVSFGLPRRRTLNEAMCYLAKENGCDTAFIDPQQVKSFRPDDEDFQLAMAALKGEDMYCAGYIAWCRANAE